jgi:CheY-like chemotaxis protein
LLSNAIKFTEKGQVILRVKARMPVPASNSHPSYWLHFEVEDTGCGMAPHEIKQLFQAFVQTQSGQRASEGTGLGLKISHKFVGLMGGQISVQSQVGRGSLFRVQIPVETASAADVPLPLSSQAIVGLAPQQRVHRILIAEDQSDNRQLLVRLLEQVGFVVREASNGQEAVNLWRQWNPSLVLMDIHMPVLDGYRAVRQIRTIERMQGHQQKLTTLVQTKIIALTADVFEETRLAILSAGCDDFVRKPIQANELFNKISESLNVRYVFAEEQTGKVPMEEAPSLEVVQAQLSQMSPDWIQQLSQASVKGSDREVLDLLQALPSTSTPLTQILTEWVNCYQFDRIQDLIRSANG